MFAASKSGSADAKDAQFKNVTMLLHGNGTNGAQNNTFLDSSTNNFTITRNGNTTQGTFTPYGSNWSNYFNGSSTYLSFASNAAFAVTTTADYTVEGWINFATVTNGGVFQTTSNPTSASGPLWFGYYSGNLTVAQHGSATYNVSYAWTPTAGVWYHVAATRTSGTVRLFINGTLVKTDATTQNGVAFTQSGAAIGLVTTPSYLTGYLSNVRFVNGTSLYTAAFTPSTGSLTAVTNTVVLSCQSNRFIDNSSNNFAITTNGSPSVQRFSPFSPTTAYSTSVIGGSGYFDGSGDYLQTSSTQIIPASTTYTIEAWVYLTGSYADYRDIVCQGTSGNANRVILYINITTGELKLQIGSNGYSTGVTIVPNQWYYLAVRNNAGTYNIYVNGVSVATGTDTTTPQNTSLTIGAFSSGAEYFPGYISDVRISSTARTISLPTAPFTSDANTRLLANFTNAGILDNAMMNDLETVGNAQISTSVKKYGSASMYFDGTGDILSTPASQNFVFNGDFTVEGWVYIDSTMASSRPDNLKTFIFMGWNTGNTPQLYVYGNTTTAGVGVGYYDGTTAWEVAATVPKDQWVHIAYVRTGTALYGFVNGARYTINASISAVIGSSNTMVIAGNPNQVSAYYSYLKGYIDDLRITKGVARYTANFSVPTAAFPDKG